MAEGDTQKQIEDRLAELPQDVRDAVLSADLGAHMRDIGQKHNLHIDQVGKLEDEAMLVMLGFFDPESFNAQLQEQLSLGPEEAAAIAEEVNTAVFMPIRESLKRFTESKRVGATPAQSSEQPALSKKSSGLLPSVGQTFSQQGMLSAATPAFPPPMPAVEKMLTQPTAVTVPTPPPASNPVAKPSQPEAPKSYKADPYREPIE